MPMREQLEQLVHEMVTRGIRYDEAQREFEKKFIMQVLLKADGNLGKAADLLGIHRNTLAKRVATYQNQESPQKGTKSTNHKKLAHRLKAS